jgi:hypothetical protein
VTEDWLGRWAEGRTGWHEPAGNEGLKTYWPDVGKPGSVLVPLCGKTPDLLWLAEIGHDVVGRSSGTGQPTALSHSIAATISPFNHGLLMRCTIAARSWHCLLKNDRVTWNTPGLFSSLTRCDSLLRWSMTSAS